MNPFALFVRRDEPVRDRQYSEHFGGLVVEQVATKPAPRPPSSDAVAEVGRDPLHARPHVWVYSDLAIPWKLAVAGWPFQVPRVPGAKVVGSPTGRHNPLPDRINIAARGSMAFGDLASVDPGVPWSPAYMKLT